MARGGRIAPRGVEAASSETVTIGLRSRDGDKHATQQLRLTNQGYRVAQVRSRPTRLLDGNIGYLLIPAMDDRLIELTVARINRFATRRA